MDLNNDGNTDFLDYALLGMSESEDEDDNGGGPSGGGSGGCLKWIGISLLVLYVIKWIAEIIY